VSHFDKLILREAATPMPSWENIILSNYSGPFKIHWEAQSGALALACEIC
jgi:hypothetical protein